MTNNNLILHALGTSGGPVDTKTQGFLFQLNNDFFMVDGGTGLSSIVELFKSQSMKENKMDNVAYLYSNINDTDQYNNKINVKASIKKFTSKNLPICDLEKLNFNDKFKGNNVIEKSMDLYFKIQKNFVTHPHLDHISELIINLPILYGTGYPELRKVIYGSSTCNQYIQEHVLNGKTWPNLINESPSNIYHPEITFKEMADRQQIHVCSGISLIRMNLNHGECEVDNKTCTVESSCYIILEALNKHMHLIFGDCEWDDANFPLLITKVHNLINSGYKLKTMVIECSSKNDENVTDLYGHMNPELLCKTLNEFKHTFNKSDKINLCITHVKQTITKEDPREVILQQLTDDLEKKGLNMYLEISVLINGLSYQL